MSTRARRSTARVSAKLHTDFSVLEDKPLKSPAGVDRPRPPLVAAANPDLPTKPSVPLTKPARTTARKRRARSAPSDIESSDGEAESNKLEGASGGLDADMGDSALSDNLELDGDQTEDDWWDTFGDEVDWMELDEDHSGEWVPTGQDEHDDEASYGTRSRAKRRKRSTEEPAVTEGPVQLAPEHLPVEPIGIEAEVVINALVNSDSSTRHVKIAFFEQVHQRVLEFEPSAERVKAQRGVEAEQQNRIQSRFKKDGLIMPDWQFVKAHGDPGAPLKLKLHYAPVYDRNLAAYERNDGISSFDPSNDATGKVHAESGAIGEAVFVSDTIAWAARIPSKHGGGETAEGHPPPDKGVPFKVLDAAHLDERVPALEAEFTAHLRGSGGPSVMIVEGGHARHPLDGLYKKLDDDKDIRLVKDEVKVAHAGLRTADSTGWWEDGEVVINVVYSLSRSTDEVLAVTFLAPHACFPMMRHLGRTWGQRRAAVHLDSLLAVFKRLASPSPLVFQPPVDGRSTSTSTLSPTATSLASEDHEPMAIGSLGASASCTALAVRILPVAGCLGRGTKSKELTPEEKERRRKRRSEAGKKGAKKLHEAKDANGKSIHGVKAAEKLHEQKDADGVSTNARKGAKKGHEKKDPNGKSIHGVAAAKKLNEQKDADGVSTNARKGAKKLHEQKDADGKSTNARKGGKKSVKKLNEEKDADGVSTKAREGGAKRGEQLHLEYLDKVCVNCGAEGRNLNGARFCRGRCRKCHDYYRYHKRERPLS